MDLQRTGKRLTHTSDLLYLLYNKGGDKATWKTNYSAKDIFNYKPKIGACFNPAIFKNNSRVYINCIK